MSSKQDLVDSLEEVMRLDKEIATRQELRAGILNTTCFALKYMMLEPRPDKYE